MSKDLVRISYDPLVQFDRRRVAHLVEAFPSALWRPGQIVAYSGILGAGKTALMTLVNYAAAIAGVPVFSSYDANPVGFARLRNMFDLFEARRCLVAIDEIQHIGVDSRDSMARGKGGKIDPRVILYWVDLIRKDDVSIHYTTQSIDKVDVRIRTLTGWIFHSEETDVPNVSKVQILRYGGSTEAQQVGCFLWDKSVIYGAYDTKDKRVKLLLEPDAEPVSPFPTREALLEAAATGGRDEPAPPRAKGEARARGAPAASSGSDRNSPLIEL